MDLLKQSLLLQNAKEKSELKFDTIEGHQIQKFLGGRSLFWILLEHVCNGISQLRAHIFRQIQLYPLISDL